MNACVSVCGYMHVSMSSLQRPELLDYPGSGVTGHGEIPTWVLETKFNSFALIHWTISFVLSCCSYSCGAFYLYPKNLSKADCKSINLILVQHSGFAMINFHYIYPSIQWDNKKCSKKIKMYSFLRKSTSWLKFHTKVYIWQGKFLYLWCSLRTR